MPWTCRLILEPELDEHGHIDMSKREVGDMWYLNLPQEELLKRNLTAQYFSKNSNRKPLVVLLPGKTYFLIDGKCFNHQRGYYDGWEVNGDPPNITVSPSINIEGRYHGFLQNGVIGDDVDGRKFD